MQLRTLTLCAAMLSFAANSLYGQTPATPTANSGSMAASAPGINPSLQALLAQIDRSAAQAAQDISGLRVEKWKADSNSKQQAESNAESLQRNLSGALPALTSGVRAAPQNLGPSFKLYRNLSALYDVMASLAESAGAFGSKQEFETLGRITSAFDGYRRSLGDQLELLSSAKDAELSRLKSIQRPVVMPPPKKIIVDDNVATKPKSKSKKKQ